MAASATGKRSIIIFWALFLVPTLIVAAGGFTLLSHEQERIRMSADAALAAQAKNVAETIHLTLEDVRQNLSQALLDLDEIALSERLARWEAANPLVRNVFVYRKTFGIEYPPLQDKWASGEEQRFIQRYGALFTGRLAFDFNQPDLTDNQSGRQSSIASAGRLRKKSIYEDQRPVEKISSRKALAELSRVMESSPDSGDLADNPGAGLKDRREKSGWIPWYSENQLFILGWVQKRINGPVYGIELELATLLSRIVSDFPQPRQAHAALEIQDGSGRVMHRSGALDADAKKDQPVASLSISPLLPHWRLAAYADSGGLVEQKGFLYLSVMLLGIFICAIISGGMLLTRMTLRNMKDARQKTSFVSSVSHELKTPLTSIRMYAELLLSGRINQPEKTRDYLTVITDESRRLTRLINNVLDFGRLEQGRKRYHYSIFDVSGLLDSLVRTHGIRIEEQGLEIITRIKPGVFEIKSDRDALEQVALNLLDNALKYAPGGRFIKFILEKEDRFILLKICDDGPGIPTAQQKLIFEKFHRIDDSLTAEKPGSGLGLSISKRILQDLGGDLSFEPSPGRGSCFTMRIKDHGAD